MTLSRHPCACQFFMTLQMLHNKDTKNGCLFKADTMRTQKWYIASLAVHSYLCPVTNGVGPPHGNSTGGMECNSSKTYSLICDMMKALCKRLAIIQLHS